MRAMNLQEDINNESTVCAKRKMCSIGLLSQQEFPMLFWFTLSTIAPKKKKTQAKSVGRSQDVIY
jgi:hypothetical protein